MLTKRYTTLATNTLLFAINAVSSKLITFLLVPIYTSYMTAGEFGLADMSTTVISLITPLATLAIADAVVRFMVEDRDDVGLYAAIGFGITAASIVLVALLSPILSLPVFGGLDAYRGFFIVAYGTSAMLHYCGNVARGLDKVRIIPICATLSSAITCASAILLLGRYDLSVEGYFISVSLGPLVGIAGYLFFGGIWREILTGIVRLRGMLGLEVNQVVKSMLVYSLPLIPNSLLWWIGTSINRFFITAMIGISATGLYAAASRIPTLINATYAIFQQAWQLSSFQESKKEGIEHFYETVFVFVQAAMTVMCCAICFLSPVLAKIMLRGETYESWPMIGLLVIANLMNVFNMFYGTVYTSTMNTAYIMSTTAYGSISCTLLTPILIMALGIKGACIASVIGQGLVFALRANKSKRYICFDPHWSCLMPTIVLLLVQSYATGFQIPYWKAVSACCLFLVIVLQLQNIIRYRRAR